MLIVHFCIKKFISYGNFSQKQTNRIVAFVRLTVKEKEITINT